MECWVNSEFSKLEFSMSTEIKHKHFDRYFIFGLMIIIWFINTMFFHYMMWSGTVTQYLSSLKYYFKRKMKNKTKKKE